MRQSYQHHSIRDRFGPFNILNTADPGRSGDGCRHPFFAHEVRMKKAMLLVALAAWVGVTGVSSVSSAQEGPPQPAPEHKRIEYFKGTWNFVGDAKASPMALAAP